MVKFEFKKVSFDLAQVPAVSFGLAQAPATFQQLINEILNSLPFVLDI